MNVFVALHLQLHVHVHVYNVHVQYVHIYAACHDLFIAYNHVVQHINTLALVPLPQAESGQTQQE